MIDLDKAQQALKQTPAGGRIHVTRRWLEQAIAELEAARSRGRVDVMRLDLPPVMRK